MPDADIPLEHQGEYVFAAMTVGDEPGCLVMRDAEFTEAGVLSSVEQQFGAKARIDLVIHGLSLRAAATLEVLHGKMPGSTTRHMLMQLLTSPSN